MDLKDVIREYIQKSKYMQIATSASSQPWVCTLVYAYDEEFNFYWLSLPDTKHSKHISQNTKVAGTIMNPELQEDAIRGLQFEGEATELSGGDEAAAVKIYCEQLGRDQSLLDDMRSGKNPHRIYKVKTNRFVLFDTKNFKEQPRQEVELSKQ